MESTWNLIKIKNLKHASSMTHMVNSSEKVMAIEELDKQDLFGDIGGCVVASNFRNLKYNAHVHTQFS